MFIDIHCHAYKYPWPRPNGKPMFSSPDQLIERFDQVGIERGVLLPFANPECFLPQTTDEILEIARTWPGRFISFCNIDPRAVTNSANAPLGYILNYYRDKGCKGVGEVCANLPFLHPMVLNLFKHVEEAGLPLTFHIAPEAGGCYGLIDEPGLPQFEQCLQRFPQLIFLGHSTAFWAEIGRLENPNDRWIYPGYPVREEGVVPKLMRQYPNLYGDLSANSGCNALTRDPEYGVTFLNEFQDRLLFGTDICAPDTPTPLVSYLLELRAQGRISETVFQKVARLNAIKAFAL